MQYLYISFIILLGLIFGSFVNAWVWRTHAGKSVAKGRSACPSCKHQLRWYDLVPVLSYLLLKGKCRYCHKQISIQYPVVEASTALLFGLVFWNYRNSIDSPIAWVNLAIILTVSVLLVATFVYDARYMLIPEKFVLPAIVLGVINIGITAISYGWDNLIPQLIALGLIMIFYISLWYFSKGQWLGAGDIRLVAIMGLFLNPKQLIVGLFASYMVGATYGAVLLSKSKQKRRIKVAFGPFLIIGFYVGLFWGESIANWYLSLL